MVRRTEERTPNPALAPRSWTSSGVEILAAVGAPETVKQRHFLLHFAAYFTQQQKGSILVVEGYQIDAAMGQHDPLAGE